MSSPISRCRKYSGICGENTCRCNKWAPVSDWCLGISFFREGYLIHLPNTVLNVAISCSGIRYLVSYFVFGIAYAYLYRKTVWSRIIVIFSIIPISLIASILRLTVIFLLTYIFGPHMADYWPHVLISWSVFFIVLILAIGLDQFFLNKPQVKKKTLNL